MAQHPQRTAAFFSHFETLQETRLKRCRVHPRRTIIFIAVCAMLSGANGFIAMATFGRSRRAWLASFVDVAGGIASHDTFGRVFAALDPEQCSACFVNWVQCIHEVTVGQLVSIAGKTARASLACRKGKHPLHVVSAWVTAKRPSVGIGALSMAYLGYWIGTLARIVAARAPTTPPPIWPRCGGGC